MKQSRTTSSVLLSTRSSSKPFFGPSIPLYSPGSRIWKIGFSGEPRPRKVFFVKDSFNSKPKSRAEAALTSANEEEDGEAEEEGIWDVDLSGMSVGLDRFRRRNGWGEEGDADDEPEAERTGEDEGEGDGSGHAAAESGGRHGEGENEQVSEMKGRVEGETKERRDEVLNVIRARSIKVLRDVYYK